jgi:hypothetical protein
MDSVIKLDDLVPGDVLLYKGTSFISRAIQFFDGTDFSHAALYLGDGMVGEAIASGLKRRSYEEGAGDNWVEAYRLKDVVPTMDPVLDKAKAYLDQGNRYGYEQLLLLALLCLTRKLRFSPTLRRLVRTALDAAAAIVSRMMSEDREPIICSEFVYRAYDEAMPASDDIYSIWVNKLAAPSATELTRGLSSGMAVTPVEGQGIHPQSLLALINSSSGSAWVGPAPMEGARGLPAQPEPDSEQLERLIETYLQEAQADPREAPRSGAPEELALEELRDASQRFAFNLYSAHQASEGARGISETEALATFSTYLTQVAADFVTPGDLHKSQSLFPLGKIEL